MRCTLLQYAICVLMVVLVLLQLLHLSMISWLDKRGPNRVQSRLGGVAPRLDTDATGGKHQAKNWTLHQGDQLQMRHVTLPHPKLNTYGAYKIFYDFTRSRSRLKAVKKRDVTLITHCSVNKLYHLPELVDRWKGPVSVAVFGTVSKVKSIVSFALSLRECYEQIKQDVTFHLVHPVSSMAEEAEIFGTVGKDRSFVVPIVQCTKLLDAIRVSDNGTQNYALDGVAYPNNLLRNVGRMNTLTDYHLMLDIDLLPSCNLRESFLTLVQGSLSLWLDQDMVQQMVFVLPSFEADATLQPSLLEDKQGLLNLAEQGRVRPFYLQACPHCQEHTDYARWASLQSFTGQLGVGYTVEWKPLWEPFYIGGSDVPLYDERFRQYGYNRISQVCELYMAGYNFAVLDQAFVYHKGLKEKTEFHQQKDEENRRNRALFLQFHSALEDKYPETQRQCLT